MRALVDIDLKIYFRLILFLGSLQGNSSEILEVSEINESLQKRSMLQRDEYNKSYLINLIEKMSFSKAGSKSDVMNLIL